MKLSNILGINARTQLFAYKYNTRRGKYIADSKIQTARVLRRAEIPHPLVFKKFRSTDDINSFDWKTLPSAFALKPSRGLGGEGIVVVKRKAKDGDGWVTTQKKRISIDDLKFHTQDILEGAYSMGNVPDVAFVQEYVGRHKAFKRYSYRGTPDIRIIVFNKVPIMAMLRLPTKESGGRANLHQGAIAVGVDVATGITTRAMWHGKEIKTKPDSKRKLHGIKIPNWTACLETAVCAQIASGLGYVGVDIILHPEKGPMVLELNAQPGLQIQLANMTGLRKRLDRVEDLEVRDPDHGVKIAKALFAAGFSLRVKGEETKILSPIEKIALYSYDQKHKVTLDARVDTGAKRSSIDRALAEELGLLVESNILWKDRYQYRSATGLQTRPVVSVKVVLAGKKFRTSASVADRKKMKNKFLIGRNDLTGFYVKPG
jgi:alpha-L-glutamate ligase-like protein